MLMVESFTKVINGSFKLTSASSDIGIEGLFQSIGKKLLRLIVMKKMKK